MSVRMALAKLSAFAAGGAIIGGGAVHVAEAPASQVQYVKHAKPAKRVAVAKPVKRKITRVAAAQPRARKIRRVITKSYSCEAPPPAMAMAVPFMPRRSAGMEKSALKPPKLSFSPSKLPLMAGELMACCELLDQPTVAFHTKGALSL